MVLKRCGGGGGEADQGYDLPLPILFYTCTNAIQDLSYITQWTGYCNYND